MSFNVDFLVVGAGFSGLVMAEQLVRNLDASVLIVDKRNHIGGNAHDYYDSSGVLIHAYGPHYFRTNSDKVRDYLSQFTEWHNVKYRIKSFARGRYWSFPINLNTFEEFIGRESSTEEFELWLEQERISSGVPKNSEDVVVSQVGIKFFQLFFEGYTLKQWNRHPRELDASVCGRIPVRTNRDDRYLNDSFQALPLNGYHVLFKKLLESIKHRVELRLNTQYREILHEAQFRHLVFTGPIDEYFNYCEGHLPYRSLRFEHESFEPSKLLERESVSGKRGFWQSAMQINYPELSFPFSRIVEIKHATGQICPATTIVREFPESFTLGNEPYYPVPSPDSGRIYQRYKELAEREQNVTFVGRLARYRYYNMDQVVGMALAESARLIAEIRKNKY
ncbi:MAG TPA: UDP-galactopyranose mutase [Oligoflexia bacterium]|nr:UDP-galactopyranose mutase [Oligoflexia bacterium]HMP48371.1 UDP-galactopyranose mutase [Oligoflexia bacterium]